MAMLGAELGALWNVHGHHTDTHTYEIPPNTRRAEMQFCLASASALQRCLMSAAAEPVRCGRH